MEKPGDPTRERCRGYQPARRGARDGQAQGGTPDLASRLRAFGVAATSAPALVGWLVLVTLLAAGPLEGLDRALNGPWSQQYFPALRPFAIQWLDKIASAMVAMSVVSVVAMTVAWQARSLRPLLLAAIAVPSETALVVAMKLTLARPRPITGDPDFFDGGTVAGGIDHTIYPSGHVANAVLMFGLAAYLVARYTPGRQSARTLRCTVAVLTVVAALTSLYLQWHWATDLLGGAIVGGLVLRPIVHWDRATEAKLLPWPLLPRRARLVEHLRPYPARAPWAMRAHRQTPGPPAPAERNHSNDHGRHASDTQEQNERGTVV